MFPAHVGMMLLSDDLKKGFTTSSFFKLEVQYDNLVGKQGMYEKMQ